MSVASAQFSTPYGDFTLDRYPYRSKEPLQAWCSADSLLLEAAAQQQLQPASTLLLNDEQGALCVPFRATGLWTDSALAAIAVRANLQANHLPHIPITWSTGQPPGTHSAVMMRIPKQLPYFEYQLGTLAQLLPEGARVLAAGMDKHLSPYTARLLDHYIGVTRRHRGRRKARLFESIRRSGPCPPPPGATSYYCRELDAELYCQPNVFSRTQLDIGTRFLLQHLNQLDSVDSAIDLACGNGVIGLATCQSGLAQHVAFCDESAMAVASARENCQRLYPGSPDRFSFFHGDGLLDYPGKRADLILCNPPFHSQHAVDEFAGKRLLQQCGDYLHSGGTLCLVANRHLDYGPVLRRKFTFAERLAQNSKFILWLARK